MMTNGEMTIYHAHKDGFIREVADSVMWQEITKTAMTEKGIVADDVCEIYVPLSSVKSPPKKGDIVLKGVCNFPLSLDKENNIKALKATGADVRTVVAVEKCDYGSDTMKHWEVTGRWA